ncbi:hypothetical protein Psch_03854 [Pelotomaculum schinkii]|uniref:Uncharacterized protein n=1 Tax=Pelotomaculum schinkii TaxID=78350 RepID=A0A4Y7R5Y6_9FIRM|nr:hypothetical protein Psch_03854 [Pelotomaculum schinkii]
MMRYTWEVLNWGCKNNNNLEAQAAGSPAKVSTGIETIGWKSVPEVVWGG